MTREDIIRMAEDAGFIWETDHPAIVALAQLAYAAGAAAEREACAQVCENMSLEWQNQPNIAQAELATIMDCALAIRTRGEK